MHYLFVSYRYIIFEWCLVRIDVQYSWYIKYLFSFGATKYSCLMYVSATSETLSDALFVRHQLLYIRKLNHILPGCGMCWILIFIHLVKKRFIFFTSRVQILIFLNNGLYIQLIIFLKLIKLYYNFRVSYIYREIEQYLCG